MSQSYNYRQPWGLSYYGDFTRWSIIEGDTVMFAPYKTPQDYVDQLSLNGLYYIAT
jgi:hypothetical protein